nr:immunoglobulin heavy chain junction region [Mus musculus]MBK4197574.1 immunoglobulin heavy chain junction region [Mus musculus]MBK4197575.1 immunoglobulin heavy chain junction region [Mus musculus]MBK4197576.1 immunoglobulin heavy chain junction region [Mus musculus]
CARGRTFGRYCDYW